MKAFDWVVCPGCGHHEALEAADRRMEKGGWSCPECSYGLAEGEGRPPTIFELISNLDGFGEWVDVDIAAYSRKVTALILVGADSFNPTAARTIGLVFMGHFPQVAQALLPMMGSLSGELASVSAKSTSTQKEA